MGTIWESEIRRGGECSRKRKLIGESSRMQNWESRVMCSRIHGGQVILGEE